MSDNKKGLFSEIQAGFKHNRLGDLLVQGGKLTQDQLNSALQKQKETGKSLGNIVAELGYVSKTHIRARLFEQITYRFLATSLTLFIGFSSFGTTAPAKASTLNAKAQFQQQSMIHKASYGGRNSVKNLQNNSQSKLFGTREIASKDISAFKKWTNILNRLDDVSFKDSQINQFRGMSLSSKVVAVNEHVNQFKYIEDKKNFGKSDYWATPTEFFARGGDCEDFAIAKYAILKKLGVPESKMRLAIVQDKIKKIPHAVLIVYTNTGPMLLDNQLKTTKQVSSVSRYKPIYSINATGWWRHIG